MTKVITYGTYDLLHYGHINLLKRAKALGDYLIVGVTTDNFDRSRGKLFVHQSLEERIAAVKATGLADEVIIEEYDGQKIDDIKKYNIDIFAIGSDWIGKFDYIGEYCKLVYLPRTEGISSTEVRNAGKTVRIGICGYSQSIGKFINESKYISGMAINDFYVDDGSENLSDFEGFTQHSSFEELIDNVDAVYVVSAPAKRYELIKKALESKKHVLCESPITLCTKQTTELYDIASKNEVVLCEALKTAFSLAFQRMCLLLKTGIIGDIKSIDATCTSLWVKENWFDDTEAGGGAVSAWGSYTILPAIKLFGLNYKDLSFVTLRNQYGSDIFTKIQLIYPNGVATLKVGTGVKSEGNLVISGTKGYIYVPSPWWKTEYFEVRKEDSRENRKFFYQFEGEGIRYELAEFIKHIRCGYNFSSLSSKESSAISGIIESFKNNENLTEIK